MIHNHEPEGAEKDPGADKREAKGAARRVRGPPSSAVKVNPGTIMKNRWKIKEQIGMGSFGQVFSAFDIKLSKKVAIKIEAASRARSTLGLEARIMQKMQGSPYAPKFVHYGSFEKQRYLVMELMHSDLAKVKKEYDKVPLELTLLIAIQTVTAIEDFHDTGYVHRDIKPSNFLRRIPKGNTSFLEQLMEEGQDYRSHGLAACSIVDYGLARSYLYKNGHHRENRGRVGFRGTARYASINSHEGKDLSRRDDLMSYFYMIVEFAKGSLPWSRVNRKEDIALYKKRYLGDKGIGLLTEETFPSLSKIGKYIFSLEFDQKPDYEMIRNSLIFEYSLHTAPQGPLTPGGHMSLSTTSTLSQMAEKNITFATQDTSAITGSMTKNSTLSIHSRGRRKISRGLALPKLEGVPKKYLDRGRISTKKRETFDRLDVRFSYKFDMDTDDDDFKSTNNPSKVPSAGKKTAKSDSKDAARGNPKLDMFEKTTSTRTLEGEQDDDSEAGSSKSKAAKEPMCAICNTF